MVNVLDGVTIEVESDGRRYRVRYLGVQIPADGPSDGAAHATAEDALEFNRFLVEGKVVQLEKDAVDADPTGNLLRYVFVGGEMVNTALLTNGYATVSDSPPSFRYETEFSIAEENAKADQRGIWTPSRPDSRDNAAAHATPTAVPRFSGGTLPLPPGMRRVGECDYSDTTQPVIKGNVDSRTGERIYHVPDGLFYSTTVIDESQGDRWFCTEMEATAAGWKRSKR